MTVWDLVHPDDRDMIREYRGRRLQHHEAPAHYDTRVITKSGATRWLDVRESTFELAGEQTILITGVDITAGKASEQAVRDSESQQRVLLDNYFDGIGVIADGAFAYVNPTMCRMFDRDAEELIWCEPIEITLAVHHHDRARRSIPPNTTGFARTGRHSPSK